MENQHRKIKTYRELSQDDIDLMNAVKAKEAEFLALLIEVRSKVRDAYSKSMPSLMSESDDEFKRIQAAEPFRWLAIAKTDIQTASMAAVRAIAQPTT